jgi:hypothetical protein
VTATRGSYVEELAPAGCRYSGAFGPGAYSVRVERAGFLPRIVPNVEIVENKSDCCDVTESAPIEIRLSPIPGEGS